MTPVKVEPPKAPPHILKTSSPINILKVESIKLPTWSGKDVEVTGMNDTADAYIPGVPNFGEGEIDVMFLPTQAASVRALKNLPATFVVTYPSAQVDTWSGWINSYGLEVSVKDKIKCKIKVRASSDVVSSGTTTGTVPQIGLGTTLTITAS